MSNVPAPNLVVIAGQSVDIDNDPCGLCRALRALRMQVATGGQVQEMEIRSPVTSRRTRFSSSSKLSDIDDMIAEAQVACDLKNGVQPRRTRFAMRGTFRPY